MRLFKLFRQHQIDDVFEDKRWLRHLYLQLFLLTRYRAHFNLLLCVCVCGQKSFFHKLSRFFGSLFVSLVRIKSYSSSICWNGRKLSIKYLRKSRHHVKSFVAITSIVANIENKQTNEYIYSFFRWDTEEWQNIILNNFVVFVSHHLHIRALTEILSK